MGGIREDARMIFHNSRLTGRGVGEDTNCAWSRRGPCTDLHVVKPAWRLILSAPTTSEIIMKWNKIQQNSCLPCVS